ncbi:MAG: HAD family phosphatase [Bacteroidetes bacterium]|nr:HAD family phosphatase [Bacteroidota bacterium]
MNRINTVLFDLGNVIVYIDFNSFWRELGFFRMEEILPFKKGYSSLTLKYETGNIATDEYLNGLRIVFQDKFTNEQIEQAFSSIIKQPVEGMADIVKRVSANCQTALVSNTNEIHYKQSLIKLDGLKSFQKHYLSYQLKVMKPSGDFYDFIIKDQGIPAHDMLFIDDIEENVEAAKKTGIQSVLFTGTSELEKKFFKLGVL